MQTEAPKRSVWWLVTGLVLLSMAIACTVLYNHSSVEAAVHGDAGVISSADFEIERVKVPEAAGIHHGGGRGGHPVSGPRPRPGPVQHQHAGPVQVATEHEEEAPDAVDHTHAAHGGGVEDTGNDVPETAEDRDNEDVEYPKRPEGPRGPHRVEASKPKSKAPRPVQASKPKAKKPAPVAAGNTCYKIAGSSVNVRNAPCGTVVTSLSQGTMVTAVGSPQGKSPCSVGNFQWQQIAGPANGWVATTLLTATACPAPPTPPPPTTTTCYTPTQNGVNVRRTPCGDVVTQVNAGTVLRGVGSASGASSCSLGSYQWQQVSGSVSGYIAATYLQTVSCSSTPQPPTPPPSGGSYRGKGIDISQPCGNWQCIKDAGYTFAIPRIYRETGSVDPNGVASVRAAAAVGLKTDVYVYPAGFQSTNGVKMANDVIAAIRGLPVGRVWLDIEGVGKSWPSNTAANQKLFKDLADTFTNAGVAVGVYTQGWQWNAIMGSSFTYGAQFPLWYAEYGQGPGRYTTTDGTCSYSGSSQNFNGFSAFGGWSRPFAKQYNGDCSKCGCGTDANIVP